MFVVFVFASVSQAWAATYTFSPNPPVAGPPFSITSSFSGDTIFVFSGSTCFGPNHIAFGTGGSVSVPAQPAGPYSYFASEQTCTTFSVVPASIPEYPYGLVLLAVFMVLGYAVIKRKTRLA